MSRGGYQRPSHPAPVSGPTHLSRRTDGGPAQALQDVSGGAYGDRKDFRSIEAGAPMAASPSPSVHNPAAGGQAPPLPLEGALPTGLLEPTQRPNEPITAGSAVGPGPGPALNLPAPGATAYLSARDTLRQLQNAAPGNPAVEYLLGQLQARGL